MKAKFFSTYFIYLSEMDKIQLIILVFTSTIGVLTLYFVMRSSGFFKPDILSIVPVLTYPNYMGKIPIYHLWEKQDEEWNKPLTILKNLDIAYDICVERLFLCIDNKSYQINGSGGQKLPFIVTKGSMKLYDISEHLTFLYNNYIKDKKEFEKMKISKKLEEGIVTSFEGYLISIYLKVYISERDKPYISDDIEFFLAEKSHNK